MKKLLLIFLLIGSLVPQTSLHAGMKMAKAKAIAKIALGAAGIPLSGYFLLSARKMNNKAKQCNNEQGLRCEKITSNALGLKKTGKALKRNVIHNCISPLFLLPLSLIAIQSGINDLKALKNDAVRV